MTCCSPFFIPFLFLLSLEISSGAILPRLRHLNFNEIKTSSDYVTHYYQQTLDHFSYRKESYATFTQKYVINTKYWGGAHTNSPIFVYFEGEEKLRLSHTIFSQEAPRLKALLLFIEHRNYGVSIPFGKSSNDETTLGYLSSEQALADFAQIISSLKTNLSAEHCPVIVYGGSYAGMLASWFRLKYPHIALGAWASSAPVMYFTGKNKVDKYDLVVTKDFQDVSDTCFQSIKKSWALIDELGSRTNGLQNLTRKFKLCHLNSTKDFKVLLMYIFRGAAQYGFVDIVCDPIDKMHHADLLTRIATGIYPIESTGQYGVELVGNCYSSSKDDANLAWTWQVCTELIGPTVQPKYTIFPYSNGSDDESDCKDVYNIPKRPHWLSIEFGGQDINVALNRFGSNIVFTNGLKDPYSAGGVLKNISRTIVALPTANGSHCSDFQPVMSSDPDWLTEQKKAVLKFAEGWLREYYKDLGGYEA